MVDASSGGAVPAAAVPAGDEAEDAAELLEAEVAVRTRIQGTISYRQRIAMPEGAYAMVEVRNSAGPDAQPVVAAKRIEMNGAQPPISFELDIDRMRLPMDIGFAFRAGIFVDEAPKFVSARIPVNLALSEIDLGEVMLAPFQPEPFASELDCGGKIVRLSAAADSMQLNIDGRLHNLNEVEAASGAKYQAEDKGNIIFWNKETDFSLSLDGENFSQCRLLRGGDDLAGLLTPGFRARGQEPSWLFTLGDGEAVFRTGHDGVDVSFEIGATLIDGRRASLEGGDETLVTVEARPCQDIMSGMFYPTAVTVVRGEEAFRGCGGEPGDILAANEWIVEDISGGGIIDRSRISLTFTKDGRVSGFASCNSFSGAWSATGEGISLGNAAVTQKACAPALMDQEAKVFGILRALTSFRISNKGALVLEAPDGSSLTARAAD